MQRAPLDDAVAFRRFVRALPAPEVDARVLGELLRLLRRGDGSSPPISSINPAVTSIAKRGVAVDEIGGFLDAILLAHATAGDAEADEVQSEAFFERFKPRSANQVLCGYLFQRNDIVFNCKTCQADETCVLCLKCFQNGNHEGHDVFFHRTTPGGVCDCGDSEAWAPEGFCVYHGQRNNSNATGASTGATGSIPLPQELVNVADALFEAIVAFFAEMAKRSIHVFDPERVDSRGRQMMHAVRAQLQQEHAQHGSFGASFTFGSTENSAPIVDERQFHVRVCNDDVHSDEDLIRSLNQKHIPHAEDLVRAIDSNGSELVSVNLALRHALLLMQELKIEGWHVCAVDDVHIHDEDVMLAVARWIKRICSLSKPLHDLFCDKLFAVPDSPPDALAQAKEPIHTMFLSDAYFRKDIALELYELYLKLQGDKDPKLKFSIVFMKVYNRMMLKYFCGIGTREESIFQYGVQILTTPSIVNHLAGMGLLEMLLDTINTALDLAKQTTSQLSEGLAAAGTHAGRGIGSITGSIPGFGGRHAPHLHLAGSGRGGISPSNLWQTLDCEHPILKFRRYHYVIENLSYVLGITSMCSELLLRKDLLRKWFDALNLIQGLDPQVRIQEGRAHVTYETQTWLTAFSFHSSVSKIVALLARGLRYHEGADPDRDKEKMFHNLLTCFWEQLDRFGIPEHRFQLFTPPFGWVTGLPHRETIVKFDVGTQPVSFHNTLHNQVSSFLMEAIYYGPSRTSAGAGGEVAVPWINNWGELIRSSLQRAFGDEWIENYDKQELMIYGMMEYPLRTLVLCAQIHCGLWIRNGQNMQRQYINYVSPPWCSEQRDLDLFLVQISAPIVGFSKFLTIFFDRFGLAEWIITWLDSRNDSESGDESRAMSRSSHGGHRSSSASSVSVSAPDEKLTALLEMALMNLIWIVSELMPPLKAIEAQDTVLRREVVHRLSQQPCRLSELLDQTTFVVQTPFGGVAKKQHLARVERILAEVADEQSKRGIGGGTSDEFEDHEGDSGEPALYVLKKEFFREYDPAFYHLSRSGHEKAQFARQEALFKTWRVEDPPIPLVSSLPPAHESMQVLRLLLLERSLLGILRVIMEDATTTIGASAASSADGKRTNVMVVLRALHLVNLIVLVLQAPPSTTAVIVPESKRRQTLALLRCGPEAFEEEEDTSRGKKRVKRQFGESESDIHMSSDSDQGSVESSNTEVEDLSIVSMLVLLSTDQVQNDLETSKSTISTIYWILRELSAMDPIIHSYVDNRVWSGMKKKEASLNEKGLSKAQLKKLHQQRAIEAMMARQKAFAQSQMFAEMKDDDELDEFGDGSGSHGDDHGGAAPGTDTSSPDTIVYRPPPPPDCIICSQKKKDEPIMYIGHAQMTQVTTHALEDRPNEETVSGATSPGESGDRGDRSPAASPGSGESSSPSASSPLSSSAFPPPIFISLCGHAVHLHCWKKYFESVKAQSRYNLEHSQSNIAFDAHYGEFLCPLCQTLSSMLVPYVPISEPLTLADRERARGAMEGVFQAKQDTSSILSWLSDELPSRLDALGTESVNESQATPATGSAEYSDSEDGLEASEDDDGFDDGEDARMSGEESPSTRFVLRVQRRRERNDESRAMKQFAMSFLETMLRFQPEMSTHVTAAMAALKKSFFACGPQLAHLIWSSVATTLASVQLNGMSSAIYSLEMSGRARRSRRHHRGEFGSFGSAAESVGSVPGSAASSFSTLRITSILNPAKAKPAGPCLKTRLAVSLPESLESQLDSSTPKDDSKLNVLLRSLKQLHLLVSTQDTQRSTFYRAVIAPLAMNLRLELPADEWKESLNLGAPASLGQPILGQDLVYACVAICSNMLSTKADILLTIRSFCVLHMAQVLSQLARMPAEDEDDDEVSDADGSASDRPANDVSSSSDSDVDSRRSFSMSPPPPPTTAQLHQQQLQREHTVLMQRCLETLMDRISDAAGVGLDANDRPPPPRGNQLLLLFQSSCLSFMRQVTLLCRAFFRGENDPDASWSANFVSSLRLSTNYLAMCQQLGVPTVDQVAADADLMAYLLRAAQELQTRPFASVPAEVQRSYRQHGHVEAMLSAIDESVRLSEDANISTRRQMMRSNFEAMPALPLRFAEEKPRAGSTVDRDDDADAANGKKRYRFANVRLVRLAASYTDLHAEVLGKSKCKQTWKMVENPAICLVCAQVLCAGTECCRRRRDGMGACTHHAMTCGSGVGLFFLMRSSSVLLIFGPRSSYFGSPYLDMFGEEDINVRRGRPLFLSAKRMKALQTLYATHQLANEVARNRRTSDQYIRTNYY